MLNEQDQQLLAASPLFEAGWYAARYPDVAASGLTPLQHFLLVGAHLGRDPGPGFSATGYLDRYRDVARSGLNPLVHFERFGRQEGREAVAARPGARQARGPADEVAVDIVVPVYNALGDVRACLDSLARVRTGCRSRVLVVNDGSDEDTTQWLRQAVRSLGTEATSFELLEHDANRGYTVAVNTGLRASRAPYVVTLNSDTIVTPFWLDGLVHCMSSAPDIGIVGPLSNAASWQNVPTLYAEDGSFSINALPPDVTPDRMAAVVRQASSRRYPRTPFVNGFCYMIRREVIDQIGYMDEEAFPTGYGEENDYSIRAQDAGFALAFADDTYVFHAKSKSFGTERRIALSKAGRAALKAKHTPERVEALIARAKDTAAMDSVRARVRAMLEEATGAAELTPRDWLLRPRILFILPASPGGGGVHSVVQEVAAMRQMGVMARIAVKAEHIERYLEGYADIPNIEALVVPFTPTDLTMIAAKFDVVVATIFNSAKIVARIARTCPWVLPAYYVQDYEPHFYEEGSVDWREAHDSYALIPGAVLFAKTDWICRQVQENHGVAVQRVRASIDHDVYRPSPLRLPVGGQVRIAAMVRPKTPRRGARRTLELLQRLKQTFGDRAAIRIFGCRDDSPEFQALPRDFEFENLGVLTRPQVAALLQEADVFLDLSDYQAFGRTALEAMACGAFALVPAAGGADEFAVDGVNAIMADTLDVDACYARLTEVLDDPERVSAMQLAALETASLYSPRRAALSELMVLAPPLARLRKEAEPPVRTPLALLPALSEDGRQGRRSVTESGHVRVIQPYCQDAFASLYDVEVIEDGALPLPGTADLVILQRDLVEEVRPRFESWHRQFREAGGRMIYEIDDDLLDSEGLAARGYAGDAQALAQRVRAYARAADIVTVPTPYLADRLSEFAGKLRVVPDYIDDRLWALGDQRAADKHDVWPKPEGQVRIGYMGMPSHYEDLRLVQEAVREVQDRYGEAVDVEVVGAFETQEPLFGRRRGLPRQHGYPVFARWIQRVADWDIAIVPLGEDRSHLTRDHLRFLESAALGAAIVCSDTPLYRDLARHEENCLSVPNATRAWADALSRLIEDADLRRRLSETAQGEVAERMTLQGNGSVFMSVLADALGAS